MAFNIRKGTGHTLQQSDVVGAVKANENVVSGMICNLNSSSQLIKGCTSQGVDNLLGFALNSYTDGDVIESGKQSMLLLDGNSVIDTDQCSSTISAANYPLGSRVAADTTTGKIKAWASGDRVVGYVVSVSNTLPLTASESQNYVDLNNNTLTNTSTQPANVAVLTIKLAV